ncbi:MAG: hypothetical protein HYR77_06335 [Ignavibacteria bacterium]|nr:hypothetical protein [Ignavibacteria bacterium]
MNNAEKFKLFFTVTYRVNQRDCKLSKKHVDYFLTRFRKACSFDIGYVWALEFQRRGAVHFHLWFEEFQPKEFSEWLGLAVRRQIGLRFKDSVLNLNRFKFLTYLWLKITGQLSDEKAVRASTDLKVITSSNFVVSYAIKYAWKREQKEYGGSVVENGKVLDGWTGRFWGASRRIRNEKLYDSMNVKGIRIIRKWLSKQMGKKKVSGLWILWDKNLRDRLLMLLGHSEFMKLGRDDSTTVKRLEELRYSLQDASNRNEILKILNAVGK